MFCNPGLHVVLLVFFPSCLILLDYVKFLAVWGSASTGDETAVEGKFLSVAGTLRDKMYYRNLVSLIFVTVRKYECRLYITNIIQLQLYL
jgi:hypothetical protein